MADEIQELQMLLREAIRRHTRADNLSRGILAPTPAMPAPTNPHEGLSHASPGDLQLFVAGYDSGSGTTTVAFTSDVSIFYAGSDPLFAASDILTG